MLNKNSIDLNIEIIECQSDLQLKTRISERGFCILVSKEKYPLSKETFRKLKSCFRSITFAKVVSHK